jgi:L,D-transpeptidase YcbB
MKLTKVSLFLNLTVLAVFFQPLMASELVVSSAVSQNENYKDFKGVKAEKIKGFYQERGGNSVWIQNGNWSQNAKIVIGALHKSYEEGLEPRDYGVDQIPASLSNLSEYDKQKADVRLTAAFMQYIVDQYGGRHGLRNLDSLKLRGGHYDPDPQLMLGQGLRTPHLEKWIQDLAPGHPEYFRLKKLLSQYRQKAQSGDLPKINTPYQLVLRSRHPHVVPLRQALMGHGDLAGGRSNSDYFDEKLQNALKSFQIRHGINAVGWLDKPTIQALNIPIRNRINQIIINMERWRWIPDPVAKKYIRVNIAGFKLEAFNDGKKILDKKVIVGSHYRQTPTFAAPMTEITFNPTWHVPPRIAAEDLMPKFRKDPGFAEKHNFKILTGGRIIQGAGDGNALGHIRFTIINPYNIFLHDTSNRGLFNKEVRTLSSGCIRVQNPHELAEFALSNPVEWSRETILKSMEGNTTRVVKLPQPLNVYLVYLTTSVDEQGRAYFYQDVYRRDEIISRFLGLHKEK